MSSISSYSVLCRSTYTLSDYRIVSQFVPSSSRANHPSENVLSFMTIGKRKGQVCRGGVQKKDTQRKRWGHIPVSVPVKGGCSVFRVSVPLSSLPSERRDTLLAQLCHTFITSPSLIHSVSVTTQPSRSQPHTIGRYGQVMLCGSVCDILGRWHKKDLQSFTYCSPSL